MTKKNPAATHDAPSAAPLPRLRLNREVIAALHVRSDVRTGLLVVGNPCRGTSCPYTSLQ